MNIRRKTQEKDLSWVADLGWLCAICALYFVVLYLVIGEQVNLTDVYKRQGQDRAAAHGGEER